MFKKLWGLWMAVLPMAVFAHTGVGETTGFMHGFSHPIGGLDHMLVMVAVGIWASQMGKKALWVVPSSFVGVMVIGGVLGFSGIEIPFVEEGILVSVLVLGMLVAGAFKLPLLYNSLIVGVFALFHGHAHGAEMPETLSAMTYALGFALSTAMLHISGMGLGMFTQKIRLPKINRVAGVAITLSGLTVV